MKKFLGLGVLAAGLAACGGLRTNDYSWVRGTHYYPTNDASVIARELGYGKRVGLNAIRFRLDIEGWRADRKGYAEGIRLFLRYLLISTKKRE